jgi:CO/xanthine dehydrogenase Mo-binding subunit
MPRIKITRSEFEGNVFERETIIPDEVLEPWAEDAQLRHVGRPLPRVDGHARVTGRALYTSDVRLPGMLFARFLRSPHPHGLVRAIDSAAAEALEGVYLVWHCDQPPPVNELGGRAVFGREVAYQGQEVALVVANSRERAAEAAGAIHVTYDPLPSAVDLDAALAEGAPAVLLDGETNLINPGGEVYERGDPARGWQEAEATVDLTFTTAAAVHSALEPHGCVVQWQGDELTLWESTQGVFAARNWLAQTLNLPIDRVRVVCEYMGGGFGAKQSAGIHSMLAAQAARATGRPVRLMLDRGEEQQVGGYRSATRQRIRVGARRDGTLTCIEHEIWEHMGAHASDGFWPAGPAQSLYRCPHVRTVVWNVRANTDQGRAFRAPGYVEGMVALEGAMDALAGELGIDPLALRLKNYAEIDPASGMPYTSKGLREAYDRGAEQCSWWQRRAAGRQRGPWCHGWGMASQVWGGGGGPPARALVKLLPDGTAEVLAGVQDIGTGTRTVLVQIAAEELGLAPGAVRLVLGDTLPTPYGPTSAGSQTLPSAGPAVRAAARDCQRQLFTLAAQMLELPDAGVEQFTMEQGDVVFRPDPVRRIPLEEVTRRLGGHMLVGDGARGPNPEEARVKTFGTQFAHVAVNVETGQLRVLQVIAVHDVGRIINPLTATSQVYGGIIQGTGYATMEERLLDSSTGLHLNADLESYLLPTVMDVPQMDALFVDRADPLVNNLGAKGLGEPPIIPAAPAIANAVSDAIGQRLTDLPLTPRRILDALRAASQGAPGLTTGEEQGAR